MSQSARRVVESCAHRTAWPVSVTLALAALLLGAASASAAVRAPGDVSGDGRASVRDEILLILQVSGGAPLDGEQASLADLDQDGAIGPIDVQRVRDLLMGRSAVISPARVATSPLPGEGAVAVTRETVIRLGRPIGESDPTASEVFASVGGQPLTARLHVSADRRAISLFYLLRLPASTRVRVTVLGDEILDAFGMPIDADGDEQPGGTALVDFDTLTLATVPGTSVHGRVFASEPGQDGGAAVETPLEGVTITVDGMESAMHAETDASGNFTLDPAPAGPFFVHVNGPTATDVGSNDFYASVGKLWEGVAGQATSVGDVYLPLVKSGTLQDVSMTERTVVAFPADVLAEHPEYEGVSLGVEPDTLFSDAGQRGGQMGIAPVASDRLPSPLPESLRLPMVITVQTSAGASNFDQPVQACFPNLPDPDTGETLPPGSPTALWSFNHDTGQWEIVGPMTVSEDGRLACTDPGVGIVAPGWHGAAAGAGGSGGGGGPSGPGSPPRPPNPPKPPPPCDKERTLAASGSIQCGLSIALAIPKTAPLLGCGIGVATGAGGAAADCHTDPEGCQGIIRDQAIGAAIGCIPFAGGVLGAVYSCLWQAGGAAKSYADCLSGAGGEVHAEEPGVPQSMLQDQAVLGALGAELLAALYGDPKWGRIEPADVPKLEAIQDALRAAGEPTSPSGKRFSASETSAFVALPRPAGITPSDMAALADRFDRMAAGLLTPEELDAPAIEAAADAYVDHATQLQAEGWQTTNDGFLVEVPALGADEDRDLEGEGTLASPLHYKLTNAFTGFVQRGRLSSQGVLPPTLMAPDSLYEIAYLEPMTLQVGSTVFRSAPNGRSFQVPRAWLGPSEQPDADGDGLHDDAEDIVGTSPTDADSDDDGHRDADEILDGSDPLDLSPARTGIVATASFPELADAQDLCGEGGVVAVAAGSAGVALFDVFAGMSPARIAQVDTPGSARRVACAGRVGGFGEEGRRLLAVADGPAGLAIVDVTDPPGADVAAQVPLGSPVQAVTTMAGIAFAGLADGTIVSVDLADGVELQRLSVGEPIADLAIASVGGADWLFALGANRLHAISLRGSAMQLGASVDSPRAGPQHWRLFVAEGIAWAVHGRGMNTFDVSDPSAPALITGGVTSQFGWKQVALNGSGLGVAAVSPNEAFDGPHHVSLYDVSDPSLVEQFITTIETPGVARSVLVSRGRAFVADSAQGAAPGALHVVNYLPAEQGSTCPPLGGGGPECPEILLSTNFTAGQVESGQIARLTASVDDDVQVRQVDFFASAGTVGLDAQPLASDETYPFEHRFVAPTLESGVTELHVRARVVDTGGNATWTPDEVLVVVPDATPPRIRLRTPPPGALSAGIRVVSARFDEALDPESIGPQSLLVTSLGADNAFGTGDDVPMTGVVGHSPASHAVSFTRTSALPPGSYRARVATGITDLSGNALASEATWFFRVVGGADLDGDGLSDDYEQAYGLDPSSSDQNGNGMADGREDFDGDGLRNDGEAALLHHVFDGDSDSGATTDRNENDNGISDASEDADADALGNAAEIAAGTDPLSPDTDRDGVSDGDEVNAWMSDPLNPASAGEPFAWRRGPMAIRDVPGGGSVALRSTPVRSTPAVSFILDAAPAPGSGVFREIVLSSPDVRILRIVHEQAGTRSPDAVVATPQPEATLTP